MSRRQIPPPRLILERERRRCMDPMERYAERHEHLELGNLSVLVSEPPPAEPAAPAPEPAAEPEDAALAREDADRVRYMARVFTPEAIAEAREVLGPKPTNSRDVTTYVRSVACLDRASRDDGWRSLPWAGSMEIADPCSSMGLEFANFAEVIAHVREQWTLARHARCAGEARIAPILLVGPPGVGKSHFAASIADRIGERLSIFSAGGAQDAMQLCGTDARWGNARTGMVFDLLSTGDSASPVLVIDEVDKIAQESTGSRDTPINTLLDLLEEDSARRYRDMSLQLEMDASRVIMITTANERERISPPLLSRLTEFRITSPTAEQRRAILQRHLLRLIERHRCPTGITFAESSVEVSLATPDLDVRTLLRMVRAGFAAALAAESDRVVLSPPRRGATKRRIGFT